MTPAPLEAYLTISAIVFALGGIGALTRRSPLAIMISIELMWNAANLAFLTFARQHLSADGHIFAFLVIVVAAAEVAIGLALIVLIFRQQRTMDVDEIHSLKG